MDPRLLDYYNQELQFIKEMGGEFAAENPTRIGAMRRCESSPDVQPGCGSCLA